MMMLVLERNGNLLHLYSSAADAESNLEVIDIENAEYEFCDTSGQRFVAEIINPVTKLRSGSFRLKPEGKPDRSVVASFILRTQTLDRSCDGVKTLTDLKKLAGL